MHNPTIRVIKILELISNKNKLNLTDISKELKIAPSTLQPILVTLVNYDFLTVNKNKQYSIGINAYIIGQNYISNKDDLSLIREVMKEIVYKCNEICQLGIHTASNPGYVVYLYKEEPYQSIKLISKIGESLPAYASALGKCLLTQFSDNEIIKIYENGLTPLTKNTITDISVLLKQVRDVEIKGYSHECGESSSDIECYAVPIKISNDVLVSLSVSVPIYRMSDKKRTEIIKILLDSKIFLNNLLF